MTFLNHKKPLKTLMIQSDNLEYIYEVIERSPEADAFGLQLEKLPNELCTEENLCSIFAAMGRPVYVTNYQSSVNKEKSYEELAEELKMLARCGATLIDVMGDYFCKHPEELTDDPAAIQKQKELIAELHALGAEVLMSSHVLKFTPAERVLEIARAQKERGADVIKIVTGAEGPEQEVENLRIVTLLKKELGETPFLYLSGGDCKILRRCGPMLGSCMWLCVLEHNKYATKSQPRLDKLQQVIDGFDF
ncbi:MAG: type I 3-dehydroquinate dehydratase [Clostridia bacterium]|nr:type I 3-dehydroquinate dehydratase [Clostridia bacterium]